MAPKQSLTGALAIVFALAACGSPQQTGPTPRALSVESSTTTEQTTTTTQAPTTTTTEQQALTVARVIDGDTVVMSDGSKIRLIGIDTPERGQDGFTEASVALEQLVLGQVVTLVPGARDDVDRYGRLLRYIDVNGTDAGLALIEADLAIARYDSRDGYGAHDREAIYVEADNPTPTTTLDPDYGTCRAAKANGAGPYYEGQDPEYEWYRDGDKDGIVCE